jgi:hypothetical protein
MQNAEETGQNMKYVVSYHEQLTTTQTLSLDVI